MAKINGISIKIVDNTYKHNPLNVASADTINGYKNEVKFATTQLVEEVNKLDPYMDDMDDIIYYAKCVKNFQKKIKESSRRNYIIEEIKKVLLEDMEADSFYTLSQLVEHVYRVHHLYVSETLHHNSKPTPNAPVHGVRYALEELEKMGAIGHTIAEIKEENPTRYAGMLRVYFLK